MPNAIPATRWVAILTVVAVLAVFSFLALRMRAGDDPSIGMLARSGASTSSPTTDEDATQDLFGDDTTNDDSTTNTDAQSGSAPSSQTPSPTPTTRAS